MQSKANIGYYTPMAGLASIKPSNFSIPAIDTTHLQSPTQQRR
jgi:hypothetical protein